MFLKATLCELFLILLFCEEPKFASLATLLHANLSMHDSSSSFFAILASSEFFPPDVKFVCSGDSFVIHPERLRAISLHACF